ncbi:ArsR family transcriptional regulator [Kushneria sinocarnis]|uniref:ArsR family transcriptional regulator n=1 Tax=Kushneria sinocarnis TaxID=595502 RepID=A0A420WYK3_9GAMM|nr:metalloregulator ArsR/SmtB family transcription factor [Kushneria sinocarnis]RKR06240.1 ArsR family transcriptional regulator [Kushneria sinocarnis]
MSACTTSPMAEAGCEMVIESASLLKAMANENRLRILCLLRKGEMSVTELNTQLDLSQSALSQHLAVLRREELVNTRRASQTIYYSLRGEQAVAVIDTLVGLRRS